MAVLVTTIFAAMFFVALVFGSEDVEDVLVSGAICASGWLMAMTLGVWS